MHKIKELVHNHDFTEIKSQHKLNISRHDRQKKSNNIVIIFAVVEFKVFLRS